MEIELDYTKDLGNNANEYFEKAKKLKNKNKKILEIIEKSEKDLVKLEKLDSVELAKHEKKPKVAKKKTWVSAFKYMLTSSGNIVLLGTDQQANENLIVKYTTDNDIVFHTMLAGSGYGVINKNNFDIKILDVEVEPLESLFDNKQVLDEICLFVALFSKAGKSGLYNPEVFWIKRDQMLKTSPDGVKLPRGSFYIKGTKHTVNYMDQPTGIGLFNDQLLFAPLSVFEKYNLDYVIFKSGNKKATQVAKDIIKVLRDLGNEINVEIDDVIKYIPYKKLDLDNYYLKRLQNRKNKNK